MLAEGVLGIILLLFGAELFVRGAIATAKLLKWSPLVIGVTVVAIGTSLPELTVSFFSAARGDYGLSLGNVVGSNIVNIFLILGVAILLGNIRIGTTKTPKNAWIMLLVSIFYWYWHISGNGVNPLWTFSALLMVTGFTTLEIYWAWWGKNHEDERLSKKAVGRDKIWVLIIPMAVYLIALGGNLMVTTIESLAVSWGVTTTFLGLILSSIATSLPELATTFVGLAKKEDKMVVGNIIGSNIYNMLLVGGIAGLWGNGVTLDTGVWVTHLVASVSLFLIVLFYNGKHIPKKIFWWLLIGFGGYLISLF